MNPIEVCARIRKEMEGLTSPRFIEVHVPGQESE
jgi:hypothetical protein